MKKPHKDTTKSGASNVGSTKVSKNKKNNDRKSARYKAVWEQVKLFKNEITLTVIVTITVASSYYVFLSYKPKAIRQIREVKGYKETSLLRFPYMQGAKELGSSETDKTKQVTLEVRRSPEEVRNFYRNVFADREWKKVSSSTTQDFYTDNYKRGEYTAVVTISRKDNLITVVDLNIRRN